MSNKTKSLFKRIILWLLVILLSSTTISTAVFATYSTGKTEINIDNVVDQLDWAAKWQVIANTMKKCSKDTVGGPNSWGTNKTETDWEDIFQYRPMNRSNISMGSWLQQKITGWDWSDLDGDLSCNETISKARDGYEYGIISVFAEMLNISPAQVVCNKEDTKKPGLVIPFHDGYPDPNQDCWNIYKTGKYTYYGYGSAPSFTVSSATTTWTYTNGYAYIQSLYNIWREEKSEENDYLATWEQLSDYTEEGRGAAVGYFALLNDLKSGCGAYDTGKRDGMQGGNYLYLKQLDQEDISIINEVYYFNGNTSSRMSPTGVTRTCNSSDDNDNLRKSINSRIDSVQKQAQSAFRTKCLLVAEDTWQYAKKKASAILSSTPQTVTGTIAGQEESYSNYDEVYGENGELQQIMKEYTDADKAEARKVIEDYNKWSSTTYMYVDKKENGGLECVVPDEYTVVTKPPTLDTLPIAGETEKTCSNQGGARGLGWIVCTVMNWMGSAAEGVYNDFLKPQLEVSPQLFAKPGNNVNNAPAPTEQAWKIFQGMANILFSIVLLIIIFSQLTGIGIDNYGIKKILPKLVLTAVLANLSYVICQAAVDVSNIVGNGTQNLLNNMIGEVKIAIPDSGIDGTAGNGSIPITVISGVIIAGLLVGMIGAIWQNPAIILSLLVSLLGVLIAILFIFILLAARQAAIVILIVISPLALVCYALPNTKKLFDKWLKIMQGLLLVYPICGILIGGGNFASRILLAAGMDESFAGALTAMLVSIVPLFFVPTVLKNSLNAMGSLGNKISGFGKNRSSGVQRRIRGTERYKDAQKMGLQRRTRIRAGLDKNGQLTARGRRRSTRASQTTGVRGFFNRMTGAQQRNANYIQAAKKNQATDEEANATLNNALSVSGIAAMQNAINQGGPNAPTDGAGNAMHDAKLAYYETQFQQAASQGNISQMNAIIEAAEKSGFVKAKDIAAMLRRNYGNIRGVNDVARAAWMRDLATKHGDSFLATDLEQREWLKRGGEGNLGNYGEYAMGGGANGTRGINLDDIKPEDILKLSGDSLAGLARAGAIDQGMAQRIMAMNPNMSADKRVMLGAIANGNATGATYDANGHFTGSGTIRDAATFKRESQALMNAVSNASTRANIPNMQLNSMSNVSAESVQAWTTATPQQVNIVQNFNTTGDVGQREAVWTDTNALNIPHSAPSVQQRQQQQQQQQQQHPPVNNPQGGQQGNP